jgi:hypothetical protein
MARVKQDQKEKENLAWREEAQEILEDGITLAGDIPPTRPLKMRQTPPAREWVEGIGFGARKFKRAPVQLDESGYLLSGTSVSAGLLLGDEPLEGIEWKSFVDFITPIRTLLAGDPIATGVSFSGASLWRIRAKLPPDRPIYVRLLTHPGCGLQQVELQAEHRVDGSWMSLGFLPGVALGAEQRATLVFDLGLLLKSHHPSACAQACSVYSDPEHETHLTEPRMGQQRTNPLGTLVLHWTQADRPVIYLQASIRF